MASDIDQTTADANPSKIRLAKSVAKLRASMPIRNVAASAKTASTIGGLRVDRRCDKAAQPSPPKISPMNAPDTSQPVSDGIVDAAWPQAAS